MVHSERVKKTRRNILTSPLVSTHFPENVLFSCYEKVIQGLAEPEKFFFHVEIEWRCEMKMDFSLLYKTNGNS